MFLHFKVSGQSGAGGQQQLKEIEDENKKDQVIIHLNSFRYSTVRHSRFLKILKMQATGGGAQKDPACCQHGEGSNNKGGQDKIEDEEAKKIVESLTDSITNGAAAATAAAAAAAAAAGGNGNGAGRVCTLGDISYPYST